MTTAQAVMDRPGVLDRPPEHHQVDLANIERPASAARTAVRAALAERATTPQLDDIALVATELVTNASRHAGGAARMIVDLYANCIVLWVYDHAGDPDAVTPRKAAAGDQDGRGLELVTELTERWFVWKAKDGKAVVAVFALPTEENAHHDS